MAHWGGRQQTTRINQPDPNVLIHYQNNAEKCFVHYLQVISQENPRTLEELHTIHTHLVTEIGASFQNQVRPEHSSITKNIVTLLIEQLESHYIGMSNRYRGSAQRNLPIPNKSSNELAIGIDLGTTNCCVAVKMGEKVQIISNEKGHNTTPSYVSFIEDGTFSIGDAAKSRAGFVRHADKTIFGVKRMIGRKWDDPQLQEDVRVCPYVVTNDDGDPTISVLGRTYHPEQISAIILQKLKERAETFLRWPVTKAVITVPAYFNDNQRRATKDAGELAGFEVLAILNEPTAAAIAYNKLNHQSASKTFVVYDLGGGTFDVAIFSSKDGKIETLSVDGDTHLGGEDLDGFMLEYCVKYFLQQSGINLYERANSQEKPKRDQALQTLKRIRLKCEKVKEDFTMAPDVDIVLDGVLGEFDLEVTMTREQFNKLGQPLFERTIEIVDRAMKSANIGKQQLDDVIMIGGSSKINKIQDMLKVYFGKNKLNVSINPDEAVGYGAAVHAAEIIQNPGCTTFKPNSDPHFPSIQDITPISYGIRVQNGRMSIIIPRHTKIPSTCQKNYTTSKDFDTTITIHVYQGENPAAQSNVFIGEFVIDGIPKAKAGQENITVDMDIDHNGVLQVTATIMSTGRSSNIHVKSKKADDIILAKQQMY